jgi:hypothetical protein
VKRVKLQNEKILFRRIRFVLLVYSACHLSLVEGFKVMAGTYTTDFPLTENPISEGGNWINGKTTGLDWSDVLTTNGIAFGTQAGGAADYNDSTALLTGTWRSNQTASATVYTKNQQSGSVYEEVEIRLRSSLSAHSCTGYEINFSLRNDSSAYCQIVRWNGPFGSFSYINTTNGSQCMLHNGDAVAATITNSTITAYINGVQIVQGVDSNYSSGSPGMGFYIQGATGVDGDYGFASYSATDGIKLPLTLVPEVTNAQFSFSFQTVAGQSYTIQQNSNLATTNWDTLTNFTGVGLPCQFSVPVTNTQPWLFLRVRNP